jgi:hypothetical protein
MGLLSSLPAAAKSFNEQLENYHKLVDTVVANVQGEKVIVYGPSVIGGTRGMPEFDPQIMPSIYPLRDLREVLTADGSLIVRAETGAQSVWPAKNPTPTPPGPKDDGTGNKGPTQNNGAAGGQGQGSGVSGAANNQNKGGEKKSENPTVPHLGGGTTGGYGS